MLLLCRRPTITAERGPLLGVCLGHHQTRLKEALFRVPIISYVEQRLRQLCRWPWVVSYCHAEEELLQTSLCSSPRTSQHPSSNISFLQPQHWDRMLCTVRNTPCVSPYRFCSLCPSAPLGFCWHPLLSSCSQVQHHRPVMGPFPELVALSHSLFCLIKSVSFPTLTLPSPKKIPKGCSLIHCSATCSHKRGPQPLC